MCKFHENSAGFRVLTVQQRRSTGVHLGSPGVLVLLTLDFVLGLIRAHRATLYPISPLLTPRVRLLSVIIGEQPRKAEGSV